jgi:hypothetical protein
MTLKTINNVNVDILLGLMTRLLSSCQMELVIICPFNGRRTLGGGETGDTPWLAISDEGREANKGHKIPG